MTDTRQVASLAPGTSSGSRIDYQLQLGERRYPVYFSAAGIPLSGDGEALLAMAALGAMATDTDLRLPGMLSPQFLANQRQLMQTFTGWFARYRPVSITAQALVSRPKAATGRVGSFFTGGVDSFYTFLKHREEITDLIFVHGYDVALDDLPRRQAISEMGRAIDQATGVRFIELETNAIRLFKDFGRWGLHGHGYGLGSAARHLADYLDRIYIPSSFAEADLMPWASHPQTDPLFSDERLEVIHDGCEVGRIDKVEALAADPLALAHLRVCWERVEGSYNCGRCEKCLRTMTSLEALGVLKDSATFPPRVALERVRALVMYDDSLIKFARENVRLLSARGLGDSPLARAWQQVLERPQWRNRLILRGRKIRGKWRRVIRKIRNAT
ncbi:hypothetical protein NA655_18050 [Pseudomonas kuykendallii]|uniref:Uncharacterized protein n=1 Tax=Pseudomonas kuykendallii TaxID=1007099 RepID=A0A1H2VXW5_9PSED|nr:hypothetical protein [Pseudomonas kuykendallii]MCQ4272935.1 hypothetical protein [Pseudomonas kuykendallii]SDW73195.1 hypothetical protein SAMN05216287_1377 [Pseudomonas kuykendallii]